MASDSDKILSNSRVSTASSSRGHFLPPIVSSSIENEVVLAPNCKFEDSIHPAKENVKGIIGHLTDEVSNAEAKIMKLLDCSWKDIQTAACASKNLEEKRLAVLKSDLEQTRQDLADLARRENALVKQQSSMSVDLVAETKSRKSAEKNIADLKQQLAQLQQQLNETKCDRELKIKDLTEALSSLRAQFDEKTQKVKELVEKNAKLTEKNKRTTEQLETEKKMAEKLQKELAQTNLQKSTDGRNLTLEMSKLKSKLSLASQQLSSTKEELESIRAQMKQQKEAGTTTLSKANKHHSDTIKTLQQKIKSLENEIVSLHNQYGAEIASLKNQISLLQQAQKKEQGEDYLDARIRFLVHQNRKEKENIEKQLQIKENAKVSVEY